MSQRPFTKAELAAETISRLEEWGGQMVREGVLPSIAIGMRMDATGPRPPYIWLGDMDEALAASVLRKIADQLEAMSRAAHN